MGDIALTRLKAVRKQRGLSQEGLAVKAGLTRKTINELETGRTHNPRFETIIRIATALSVEVSEVM